MSSDLLADLGVFGQKPWSPWFVQEYGGLGGGLAISAVCARSIVVVIWKVL